MPAQATDRRSAGLVAAGAAAGALIVAISPEARVLAKGLVDPLAHATSGGAALLALAFLAASALALRRRAAPVAGPMRGRVAAAFVVLVLAGNALNLAGHGTLLGRLGLPWRVAVYQWNGMENTYSYALHSHAGKAAIGAALAPFAKPLALDVGQGLEGALPAWVGLGCAATLLLSLLAYLWLLPRVVADFDGRIGVGLLFGIASLNAIKAIVDGGLLTYRCLPALLVAGCIALAPRRMALRQYTLAWSVAALLLGCFCVAGWLAPGSEGRTEALVATAEFVALLALVAALAWPGVAPDGSLRMRFGTGRSVLVAIAGVIVIHGYLREAREGVGLLLAPLANDYRAVVFDPQTLATRSVPAGGRRPIDVYREFGDDPLKPRHVFLARGGGGGGEGERAAFPIAVLAERSVHGGDVASGAWLLRAAGVRSVRTDLRVVIVDAATPTLQGSFAAEGMLAQNNYYCLLHGLAAQLHGAGLRQFAFVPLRDAADLRAVAGDPAPRPGGRQNTGAEGAPASARARSRPAGTLGGVSLN
jgi:hypothetical protein